MPKVTISLVTYNSEKYLRDLCMSLREQTFHDWDLIAIDNASVDHSAQLMREQMPSAHIVMQKENIGYSRAHNLAITWSKGQYVLVVNPDLVLDARCIERMVSYADVNPMIAAVGPTLLGWDHERHSPTGTIDSAGIAMRGPYRASDIAQGEKERPLATSRVFGVSGALALYRRSALEEIKVPRFGATGYEYFDEDFFAYKEDVDPAWRLNSAGYEQYVLSDAVAYHCRTISGAEATRQQRKKRSAVNRFSYRNHLLMLYKNHRWSMTFRRLPALLWFEASKFVYLLFLDGSSVKGFSEALGLWSKFRKKRKFIQRQRRLKSRELTTLIA